MKYQGFFIKLLSLLLIIGILYYYQITVAENAAIIAENEAKIAEVEAYNREVRLELARKAEEAAKAAGEEISYTYQSGSFEGAGDGYGGPIIVSVSLEYDILTDIKVISHDWEDASYFSYAEGIVSRVLEEQSTQIDVVSGATLSSEGILAAIDNALEEAEKQ